MKRWGKAFVLLVPLAAFIGSLYWVREWLYHGHALWGLGLLVASLAVLSMVEGALLKFWFLPGLGGALADRLYGGRYYPDEDALAVIVDGIQKKGDPGALSELEKVVRADPHRLRGWQELAHLQLTLGRDALAAVKTLVDGSRAVRGKEDRAMLLYRAAVLCHDNLGEGERARVLWGEAARRYPSSVYGLRAAARLKTLESAR